MVAAGDEKPEGVGVAPLSPTSRSGKLRHPEPARGTTLGTSTKMILRVGPIADRSNGEPFLIREIHPDRLFIGNAMDARDLRLLHDHRIAAVVATLRLKVTVFDRRS